MYFNYFFHADHLFFSSPQAINFSSTICCFDNKKFVAIILLPTVG